MPRPKTTKIGSQGEEAVCIFLQKEGFQIIKRNYFFKHYEIDIIALKNNELVFVEVKARPKDSYTHPAESISKAKQNRIVTAADHFTKTNQEIDYEVCRFDVAFYYYDIKKVEYISNAFRTI